MRKIGKSCVEPCGGMFTRLDIDDPAYEELWVKGCKDSGIEATPITLDEAFRSEPRLSRKHVKSAYLVPDAAVDGFRMAWQLKTYTEVIGFDTVNGELRGVKVRNQFTGETYEIGCDITVNAEGGWAGFVGKLAGVEIGVQPDKGTLIAFNQRIVNHVVNRLHKFCSARLNYNSRYFVNERARPRRHFHFPRGSRGLNKNRRTDF